jgi:hypothetical protein
MDGSRLLKLIVAVAVVFVLWKYGLPWAKQHFGGNPTAEAITADNSCVAAAERASESWGSGIGKFVNPPYDLEAWSTFSGNVKSSIAAAQSACEGSAESCVKARDGLRGLSSLVNDLDTSIRNGSPPPEDIVQRQDAVDTQINVARELARGGK